MKSQELADLIGELLLMEAEDSEFQSELDGADVIINTFKQADILTEDAGIEVTVGRKVYQLTVVQVSE